MKKTEIAAVVLIAMLVIGGGYYLSNLVFGDPFDSTASVEYMDKLEDGIVDPSVEVYNINAVNPTVTVCIGKDDEGNIIDCNAEAGTGNQGGNESPDGGGTDNPSTGE